MEERCGIWDRSEGRTVPVAVGAAACSIRALRSLQVAALAIVRSLQVCGGWGHIPLLKGKSARLPIITTIIILQLNHLTAERVLLAVRVGVRSKPLRVVRKAKVDLLGLTGQIKIGLDSIQGALDAGVMSGYVVAAVHQIVGHDVDHVDGLEDRGTLFLGEGDHVLSAAWDCDGQDFVADGFAEGGEEQGVGLDLVDFG